MCMGRLIGNAAILIAGSIVLMVELLAVAVLFLSATLIATGRRLTHARTA